MNETLKIVLSLSISGSLLILVLFLCKPLFKNRVSKGWQYYIWLVVVARLLLPFTLEISPIGTFFGEVDRAIIQTDTISTPGQNVAPTTQPGNDTAIANDNMGQNGSEHQSPASTLQNLVTTLFQNLWLIWLVIALILLIRKITIYQSFVRYIKAGRREVSDTVLLDQLAILGKQIGVKKPVELFTNELISSPLLLGFFRPCIVLPTANLPESDFQYTVLHELTHYKRLDMFYKWLVQLTICLHWFNPFIYIMGREVVRACELACDEAVIKELNPKEQRTYGDTLLNAMGAEGDYYNSLASVTLIEGKGLLKERLNAIMNFKKKSRIAVSITLVLTFVICFGATAIGAYAVPNLANKNIGELTESNGIFTIPVNIKSLDDGEYVWLGEYTLSAGDKIQYNIPTISGEHITVGFTKSTDLSPTYFSYINDRSNGILKVVGGFEVPASYAGTYKLFVQASNGKLADIKGTILIGKFTDNVTSASQNTITIPVDIETSKNGAFYWLGEYSLAHGDVIHYSVSASTGSGLQIGFVAQGDDPLNRTYYTVSNKKYNGLIDINSELTFSAPVKPGQYKLYIRSSDDDISNVRGFVTITKQALELETVTINDKTYYIIMTKEQLLALANGQLALDKRYMLQYDIDLSDTEWIPIGTAERPFTGSFNGNGCEIKGLTMKDPDAKVIGLFGYADGAKIMNVTLRDYDISNAGKNVKDKSVSPILVFGIDTQSTDNLTYPKK